MNLSETASYLRKYNDWRRSDPEDNRATEIPDPRELGLHIDFAASVLESMASHDHLMVIAAMRYCLGRATYIVGDSVDWIINIWPMLSDKTQNIIKRDIEEAFARDDAYRAEDNGLRALGHDCERAEWARVRALWSATQ